MTRSHCQTTSTETAAREASLLAIPLRNPLVTEEWISKGIARIRYPLPVGKVVSTVLSLFGKQKDFFSRFTKLELDAQGSKVWQAIDGQRSVKEISQSVALDMDVDLPDAEIAVATFLRELGRRGIIGLQ